MRGRRFRTTHSWVTGVCIAGVLLLALPMARAAEPTDGWPPPPNYARPVDYVAWLAERVRGDCAARDNAGPYYAELFADATRERSGRVTLGLRGFRHEPGFTMPLPWDPAEFPEWEESYEQARRLVARGRELAERGYVWFPEDQSSARFGALRVLRGDFDAPYAALRELSRGASEAAWRAPGGRIDESEFIDHVRARLGLVRQLERGLGLVAAVSALGVREQLYEDLRSAQHFDVLGAAGWRRIAEMLDKQDPPPPPLSQALQAQCAVLYSEVQYASGRDVGGATEFLRELVTVFAEQRSTPERAAQHGREALQRLAECDGGAFGAGAYAACAEALRGAREADPAVALQVPQNLERTWALRVRVEAERRGTHLLLALRAFRERYGRWPEALNELPTEALRDFGQDPFRPAPFVYRRKGESFELYSASLDGEDNGGAHDSRWTYFLKNPGSDFMFWPIVEFGGEEREP